MFSFSNRSNLSYERIHPPFLTKGGVQFIDLERKKLNFHNQYFNNMEKIYKYIENNFFQPNSPLPHRRGKPGKGWAGLEWGRGQMIE